MAFPYIRDIVLIALNRMANGGAGVPFPFLFFFCRRFSLNINNGEWIKLFMWVYRLPVEKYSINIASGRIAVRNACLPSVNAWVKTKGQMVRRTSKGTGELRQKRRPQVERMYTHTHHYRYCYGIFTHYLSHQIKHNPEKIPEDINRK